MAFRAWLLCIAAAKVTAFFEGTFADIDAVSLLQSSALRVKAESLQEEEEAAVKFKSDNAILSRYTSQPMSKEPGCKDCCMNGYDITSCFDVDTCAANGPANGRYALVLTMIHVKWLNDFLPNIASMKAAAESMGNTDVLLMMTREDEQQLQERHRQVLKKYSIKVSLVDWSLPPDLKFRRDDCCWCGRQDFVRLHVLALEGYDAVAYYDSDIQFQGDISPILKCAATGKFITTSGGAADDLNVGFFALRPDRRIRDGTLNFLREADFDRDAGWAGCGWRNHSGYYFGGECGQGLFHTFFYKPKSCGLAQQAIKKAGAQGLWDPVQIDRCTWNYQTEGGCKNFDCARIRAHHKPGKVKFDPDHPGQCQKFEPKVFEAKIDGALFVEGAMVDRSFSLLASPSYVEPSFGFYFPVFGVIPPVLATLGQIREHYPTEPIFVLSDGGNVNFTGICNLPKYGCEYEWMTPENSRWNPHSWMARFLYATKKLGTDYVIYVEPDLKVIKRHVIQPGFDAGGIYDNFNPSMSKYTVRYLEKLGRERNPCFKVQWEHFGLSGGSYYRSEAVLDAFKPEHIKRIDWAGIAPYEGDKTMSSDFAMIVALNARGWIVYPWAEAGQNFEGHGLPNDPMEWPKFHEMYPAFNLEAAFQHNHKELYNSPIGEEEQAVLERYVFSIQDTTCHGCVWYQEAIPDLPLVVPGEPPVPSSQDNIYNTQLLQADLQPCGGKEVASPTVFLQMDAQHQVAGEDDDGEGVSFLQARTHLSLYGESRGSVLDVRQPTFGFYFPVWNVIPPVLVTIGQIREHYPTDPVFVLSDGGNVNFSGICKLPRYNCTFEWMIPENSRWNPHSWMARFLYATQKLGTDYVIYVEPDLKVRKHHVIQPPLDAGGIYDNFNPTMSKYTKTYVEKLGRERNPCFTVQWEHFGLSGGSYYRSEAILDAFKPEHIERIDWAGMAPHEGDKTMSSDFAMLVALNARGWVVYPWDEAAQNFEGHGLPSDSAEWPKFRETYPAFNPDAAFQHNHKELYNSPIGEEERAAITYLQVVPETTCHGCVWYAGARPEAPLIVPSEPPLPFNQQNIYNTQFLQEAASPCGQNVSKGMTGFLQSNVRYPFFTSSSGLPLAEGPRPDWLLKDDALIIDARPTGRGGMLMMLPVMMDAGGYWGTQSNRPRWLRAILATNREHAKRHGHAAIVRWKPSEPQLTDWQRNDRICVGMNELECTKKFERENFNWEKHMMIFEYLQSNANFTHVLMLDADIALVQHNQNILGDMASVLNIQYKKLFLTNEDWLENGGNRINGGLIFAANSEWTRNLFQDTFDAHLKGPAHLNNWRVGVRDMGCSSNDQICLNDLYFGGSRGMIEPHTVVGSGIKFNRGGCTVDRCGETVSDSTMYDLGVNDPRLLILHFMGGSKNLAEKFLCQSEVYTGGSADDYGCKL